MKFRTEIPIPTYPFHINYSHQLCFIGSCFAEHIGTFFKKYHFKALVNPFGTLFNPISIANGIELALYPEKFSEDYFTFYNDLWVSFAHYGKFSHSDKSYFIERIYQQLKETQNILYKCDFLFLTFGTSYVYLLKERNLIVANCHKIPAGKFDKYRLTIEDIVSKYEPLIQQLQSVNPHLKIIFTVSPVRHLSDGFHENQLSKSTLHLAIEQLFIKHHNLFYFPAYEIVQDDLRDYRFYDLNLCHPNKAAVNYLQEVIIQSLFDEKTEFKRKQIEKEIKREGHRPMQDEN